MHRDRQAEAGGARHPGVQRLVVRGGEVVHPGGAHEGLEADHAPGRELVEAIDVARHEPAPEREVDVRRGLRGRKLEVERIAVERRRAGVERHVGEGRRAAGCKRPGSVVEPLPVGAARVVAVDVGVDDAGEDVQPVGVDRLPGAALEVRPDLGDQAVADPDVAALGAARGDHRAAANQEIEPTQPRAPVYRMNRPPAAPTRAALRTIVSGRPRGDQTGIP